MKKKLCLLILAVFVLVCVFPVSALGENTENMEKNATVLFTHDMHSHLLPVKTEEGGESGGYARLYTLLEKYRNSENSVITVDGGDFSMGSLFQTVYATDAAELRILGKLKYDVITFGNHEFDFRMQGTIDMLNNAAASKDPLPQIVEANYLPPEPGDEKYTALCDKAKEAYKNADVKDYTVVEKDGVRFAVFGLMGKEADEDTPMSGMKWEDTVVTAKRIVKEINQKENADYIICLSHSGTEYDLNSSEDVKLAKEVDGIDVIVSGHSHTTLDEPLIVNDTVIASCGEYCKNLGVIKLSKNAEGKTSLDSYSLIPVDENVEDNKEISEEIAGYKKLIDEHYLKNYNMTSDEVIAKSDFDFERTGGAQEDKALGNIITDSYVYAVKNAEGENYEYVDFALNASGVIRDTFIKGDITVSDAFDVLSLGVGADGTPGYPLVSFYLYGKEIKNGMEVDATVVPIMSAAQLYITGAHWEYNTSRMFFNKITDGYQVLEDGSKAEIEDDKLYRIVTGLYCCQMLSTVKEKSFGILEITPRHKDGSIVTDYDSIIIHDKNGNEVKEWYSLASYISSFDKIDGVSQIPERYAQARGDKVVYSSLSPIEMLKNANIYTYIALALIILIVFLLIFIPIRITKAVKRKKAKKTVNS